MKIIHEAPLTINTDSDPVKDGMYVVYTRPSSRIKIFQKHLRLFRNGKWNDTVKIYGWVGPLPNLNLED